MEKTSSWDQNMAKIHDGGSGEDIIPRQTLHDYVLEHMGHHGDSIYMINATTDTSYKFDDFITLCKNLSQGLRELGVKKGDIISIYGYNSAEFMAMTMSSLMVGMTVNTCNPVSTSYELRHYFKLVQPKIIFTEVELVRNVESACSVMDTKPIIILRQHKPGYRNFNHLSMKRFDAKNVHPINFDVKNDVAFILFSSGTTGLPKGVMLTHYNVLSHIVFGVRRSVIPEGMRTLIIGMLVFPMYHAAGLLGIVRTAVMGNQVVTFEKYELKLLLRSIQKYKPIVLAIPPSVIVQLAKTPLLVRYDVSSVMECATGAAPVKSGTEHIFRERFNNAPISNGYGMTEAVAGVISKTSSPEDQTRPGSSGTVALGTALKVVDPTSGELLGPNQRGELYIKSARVMKGYLKNPQATRDTIDAEGWLHSGDVAYYDDDGYFFIVDRLKELIKFKGNQVAPAELEALLLEHDDVTDVGVVGVPDTEAGELPRAYIVKRETSALTEQQVTDYVHERVSHYKRLRGGVVFLKEIPKTPSGKIMRRKLRELIKNVSKL